MSLNNKTNLNNYFYNSLTANIYDLVKETPLNKLEYLSLKLNNNVLAKREDFHSVHSFKIRGSYLKIKHLVKEKGKNINVIAASAGNHAQGVALSAKHLGIKATIVMPVNSPTIKVDAVSRLGAEVILYGDTFDDARDFAENKVKENPTLEFIHAFNDDLVISGQGTVALELLRQAEHIDKIFVPIGGGGLISGILAVIKSLKPEIKVIGVEASESASFYEARKKGELTKLDYIGVFADGIAIKQIGDKCFNITNDYIDDVICVSNDEICIAIKDLYEDTRTISEPSGAAAIAGMKKYVIENDIKNEVLIPIISGANMNFQTLKIVVERSEANDNREALFAIKLEESKGSFKRLLIDIGNYKINNFIYRHKEGYESFVLTSFSTVNINEINSLKSTLINKGYNLIDLSNDTTTKNHMRFLNGGHSNKKEFIYDILIRNRKVDLDNIINAISDDYNITLFHYKYYDTEYSTILCGFENKSENDLQKIESILEKNSIKFDNISNIDTYRIFLKN